MASPLPLAPDTPDPEFRDLLAQRPQLTAHAQDGLCLEDVPLARIAAEVGTPSWAYSANTLRRRYRALRDALGDAGLRATVHFAAKSNSNLAVLRVLAGEGAGADVVSGGELRLTVAGGIGADRTVFSGVGKTAAEVREALAANIFQINAESAEEVEMLSAVAAEMGLRAPVAIRVNPDVDARTHAKITTGKAENKFGVAIADAAALYARMASLPGIRPIGIAVHIGSQITEGVSAFRAAYARVAELVTALRGRGLPVERVDCGGGLGIPYRDEVAPKPEALAGAIAGALKHLDLPVMIEPGRWIAGPAGVLISRVVLVKHGATRRFVVLDAGMNDLLRPAMYDAWHGILPVGAELFHSARRPADVVGPVCETGDTFTRGRDLPELRPGDVVAMLDAGAYGAAMSSTYNARPLAAEVLVDGNRWAVVRERQPFEDLLARQSVPDWVAG
ncbi:diaminopimelate decarboxylase [Roseomonas elaeocarpi]|uniref:Diaminopimelate decarboxylase n=1 Tax=Roseomonas elaeocarpi TaxID=907779 RepID=A0ABV6JQA7_9PROT